MKKMGTRTKDWELAYLNRWFCEPGPFILLQILTAALATRLIHTWQLIVKNVTRLAGQ
jgi:hypothetical protein